MDAPLKERFRDGVIAYLNFSAKHHELAGKIADEAVARLEETLLDGSGRLSFQQKVALAANASIRHRYTAYDDLFIEKSLEQVLHPQDKGPPAHIDPGPNEVVEFIRSHRE